MIEQDSLGKSSKGYYFLKKDVDFYSQNFCSSRLQNSTKFAFVFYIFFTLISHDLKFPVSSSKILMEYLLFKDLIVPIYKKIGNS